MTVHNEQNWRTVERMTEGGKWVRTAFEDLKEGQVVRFFDPHVKIPLEQNGATVFVVVNEARQAGGNGNLKLSVAPLGLGSGKKAPSECPYFGNIVVKPYGVDKLIEATGYCAECRYMRVCVKARYSSAYFAQLRDALGLNDLDN